MDIDTDSEKDQGYLLAPSKPKYTTILGKVAVFGLLVCILVLAILLARANNKSDDVIDEPSTVASAPCPVSGATETNPPKGMRAANRVSLMRQFTNFNITPINETVMYFEGGVVQSQYYSDTELFFRQESNFLYVIGYEKPSAYFTIYGNVSGGYAILFVPRPTTQSATWNGIPESIEELKEQYEADEILYTDQFAEVMDGLNFTQVFTLPDVVFANGSQQQQAFGGLPQNDSIMISLLANARAIKSDMELEMMNIATKVSCAAHINLMEQAMTGAFLYEYQIANLFVQVSESCGGWPHQSYLPITPSGPRTAILHYNTNYEAIGLNDLILVDAGAEYYGYGADITRTWPVNGKFTEKQATLYNIVLQAQQAALAFYRPGVPFANASNAATTSLLQGLLETGMVQGPMANLTANKINSVFMPHGLGHLLGLDVHDPGIYPQSLNPPQNFSTNMVLTCEPGLYFIDELLDNAYNNSNQAPYLNQAIINDYKNEVGVGGFRIEDVILITPMSNEVLSAAIPKTVGEIEALMQKVSMR